MLDIIFWVLVGAFVGWHFPEPFWAKAIKERLMSLINRKPAE
jgi:hypothetical protein